MPSPDAFKILLVLLPGFVTTGIIRALTVSGESSESEFDKVVRALSYSFLNYALFALYFSSESARFYLDDKGTPLSEMRDVAWLGSIAVGMGLVVSFYKNNDGHRLFRWLRCTRRSSRASVWHDSLVAGEKFHALVTLEDGRRILGWPIRYSDDMGAPAIYLKEAVWLDEDNKEFPAGNEGILLLAPMKIASVEWVRSKESKEKKTAPLRERISSVWKRANFRQKKETKFDG